MHFASSLSCLVEIEIHFQITGTGHVPTLLKGVLILVGIFIARGLVADFINQTGRPKHNEGHLRWVKILELLLAENSHTAETGFGNARIASTRVREDFSRIRSASSI